MESINPLLEMADEWKQFLLRLFCILGAYSAQELANLAP